jgi:uncharacterized protein YdhG (YjbR/CyaY superfamily)
VAVQQDGSPVGTGDRDANGGVRLRSRRSYADHNKGASSVPADDKKAATKPAKANQGLSAEEKAAMRELVRERKASASREDGERDLREKISEMSEPDRSMAERLHALITATAPDLAPKTWYGMPAYANKDGKIICYFQPAEKFKARYATFGFNDGAHLDGGAMWPVAFALTALTADDEAKIAALVKKAAG